MLRKGISLSALVLAAGSALGQVTGPSTTTSPYMLPAGPNAAQVQTVSIFTVGDIIGGYRMVGIPDGLGAMSNGNGTFDLFMNHELGATVGAVRAHGQTGAFVSRWNISNNLTVNSGRDHNQAGTDSTPGRLGPTSTAPPPTAASAPPTSPRPAPSSSATSAPMPASS